MKITEVWNLTRRCLENTYTAYQSAQNWQMNTERLYIACESLSLLAHTHTRAFCMEQRQIQALKFFLFSVGIEKCYVEINCH